VVAVYNYRTAKIVVIVTQQASKDAADLWIVDQTGKILALINEWNSTRTGGSIVVVSVMPNVNWFKQVRIPRQCGQYDRPVI